MGSKGVGRVVGLGTAGEIPGVAPVTLACSAFVSALPIRGAFSPLVPGCHSPLPSLLCPLGRARFPPSFVRLPSSPPSRAGCSHIGGWPGHAQGQCVRLVVAPGTAGETRGRVEYFREGSRGKHPPCTLRAPRESPGLVRSWGLLRSTNPTDRLAVVPPPPFSPGRVCQGLNGLGPGTFGLPGTDFGFGALPLPLGIWGGVGGPGYPSGTARGVRSPCTSVVQWRRGPLLLPLWVGCLCCRPRCLPSVVPLSGHGV